MHRFAIALFLVSCATDSLDSQSGSDTVDSHASTTIPNSKNFPNDEGIARTFNINGSTNLTTTFTQNLGTNGRTCFTCHDPANGWSIGPDNLQDRFDKSDGT